MSIVIPMMILVLEGGAEVNLAELTKNHKCPSLVWIAVTISPQIAHTLFLYFLEKRLAISTFPFFSFTSKCFFCYL